MELEYVVKASTSSQLPPRHYLVFCDESGIHGTRYIGYGSLWMPWERRGDFVGIWRRLHEEYFPPSEVKWTKVKAKTLPFFEALVDEFFSRRWLMFHSLVASKEEVDIRCHDKDWDLARRKLFVMLLSNKIKRFAAPGKVYRIRVDPIASRYRKSDEAAELILKRQLEQSKPLRGQGCIHSLRTVDSKDSPGVQLSDLLIGAVMAARLGEVEAEPKIRLIGRIARRLGWSNLTHATFEEETKFNIWRFWDPTSGCPRPEPGRGVKLFLGPIQIPPVP